MLANTALLLISSLMRLHVTGGISADEDVYQTPHRRLANGKIGPVYQQMGALIREKTLGFKGEFLQAQPRGRVAKLMPSAFLQSHFQRAPQRQSDLLQNTDHAENKLASGHHTLTMEEKDEIELYVSSVGGSDPVAHEEMIRLLNINNLQHTQNMQATSYLNRRCDPSALMSAQRPSYMHTHLPMPTETTAQGRQFSQMSVTSSEPKTSSVSWKRAEAPQSGPSNPSTKRRRRSSPGPVIVIKDEPEDDDEVRFVNTSAKASLPDSTGVQSQSVQQGEQQSEKTPEADEDPNEDWCAVCQNGGELLCCDKCPKVFHLGCHVPTLTASPSGEWYCTFCRDLNSPEMQYNANAGGESKDLKQDLHSETFTHVDRRKCERLLLRLYCNELSTDFQEPITPSSMPEYSEIIKTPMDLSVVRSKLEGGQYKSTEDFVADVRLIFKNCATFHKEDTEMASVGANLESFFEEQVKLLYPERTFPGVKEEGIASVCPEETSPITKTPPQDTSPAEETARPSGEDLPLEEANAKEPEEKPENISSPAGSGLAEAETDSKETPAS
ncbi:transcription intermediary factor 1-alpha [Danio aesculapii]|uniref:transcription intermediary factor 1-alpha n=1 Tax=Danio aesculapii TaxID=1142201 RepID=UPI0024C0A8B4|nr:transcription intermediary factor 1-alpha [Danio aesculapii]